MAIFDGNNNPIDSGMNIEQLKSLVSDGLLKPIVMNSMEERKESKDIADDLKKVIENFDKVVEEAGEIVKLAKEGYKVKPVKVAVGGDFTKNIMSPLMKQEEKGLKLDQISTKAISAFSSAALHKGSLQTHDIHIEKLLSDMIRREEKGKSGLSSAGLDPTGRYGTQGSPDRKIGEAFSTVLEGISIADIFKGAITQEYEFMKNMREIAYQTQGVAGSTESVQDKWDTLAKSVGETGVNRTVMQNALVIATKKGIRSLEQTNKTLKNGLFTSKQIGASAEGTAELFTDWNMHLGMSGDQMDAMSGAMRNVARTTGVTGEALLRAAKSTEVILKNMRNTGMLTSSAAETFMSMAASAEKLGVGTEVQEISNLLTGGIQQFIAADPFMKTMITRGANAGGVGMEDVYSGSVGKSPEKMDKMIKGLNTSFSQFAGIGDLATRKIEDISDAELSSANKRLQIASGGKIQGVAQWQRMYEAMAEATKPFSEKMKELDKQFKSSTATTEERMVVERKRRDLMISESTKILGGFDAALKKAGSVEVAFKSTSVQKLINENRAGIEAALKVAPGGSVGMDSGKLMQGLAQTKLDSLKGLSNASNVKMQIDPGQVQRLMRSSDPSKVREAIQMLEKENKRIAVEAEAATDPVKAVNLKIMKINEDIRGYSAASMKYLSAIMGSTGLLALWFTGIGGKAVVGLGKGLFNLKDAFLQGTGKEYIAKNIASGVSGIGKQLEGTKIGDSLIALGGAADKEKGLKATLQTLWKGKAAGASTPAGLLGPEIEGTAAIAGLSGPLKLLAARAAIVGGAIAVVGSILWGLKSAFQAGEKAAFIFGVEQDKLTISQVWAAEGAGLLTGMLNFLTFGVFRKSLGPTGTATQSLSKFFAAVPPIGWAFQILLMPIKILIGVLKGLWRFVSGVFTGLWEGLMAVLMGFKPIFDALDYVFTTLSEVFQQLGGAGSGNISIIEILASTLGFLGKTIGFVFKAVGFVIGTLISTVLTPISWAIKSMMAFVKPVLEAITSLVNGIVAPFKWLYDTLVGHSIIPDLVGAVVSLFTMMAGTVMLALMPLSGIGSLIARSVGGAFSAIAGAAGGLATKIGGTFSGVVGGFVKDKVVGGAAGGIAEKAQMLLPGFGGEVAGGLKDKAAEGKEFLGGTLKKGKGLLGGLFGKESKIGGFVSGVFTRGKGLLGGLFGKGVASKLASAAEDTAGVSPAAAVGEPPKSDSLGSLAQSLKGAAGPLLKMAVAAALVIAALMVIAKIMQTVGISPKEITTVAFIMAGIIGGIVGLLALVGSLPPGTEKVIDRGGRILGKLGSALLKVIPQILFGAAVFAGLTIAIVALACAIIYASKKIMNAFEMDPQKAFQTAIQIASIISAATAIALAVIGAAGTLWALGLLNKFGKKLYKPLLSGALALIILTPAIIGMACAIIYSSNEIMKYFGMDSKKAVQTAIQIASIVASVVAISLAVVGAAGALWALGMLAQFGWALFEPLLLGALTLMILTPALLYMSGEIIKMCQKFAAVNPDPTSVANLAIGIALIIASVAAISLAIVGAAGALWALGMLCTFGAALFGPLLLGAAALYFLTNPLLELSSAVIDMCQNFLAINPDPAGAAQVAFGIAALLASVVLIGLAVANFATFLTVLGAFTALAFVLSPLIWLGSKALTYFTPALLNLASSVVFMCQEFLAVNPDPAGAAQVAFGVASLLAAVGAIGLAVVGASFALAGLGYLAIWGLALCIPMAVGAFVLYALTKSILLLATAISTMGDKILGILPEGKAKVISETIGALGQVITDLGIVMQSATSTMSDFVYGSWWTQFWKKKTPAQELEEMTPKFEEAFNGLAVFLKSVCKTVMETFEDADKVKWVSSILNSLSNMMTDVGKLLDTSLKVIVPFCSTVKGWINDGASPLDQLKEVIWPFRWSFRSLTNFLNFGIMQPILSAFEESAQVEKASDVLKSLSSMMEHVGKLLESSLAVIIPFCSKVKHWYGDVPSPMSELRKSIPAFRSSFKNLTIFLNEGIMVPILKAFEEAAQVDKAAAILASLTSMMTNVGTLLDASASKIIAFTKNTNWWGNKVPSEADKLVAAIPDFQKAFKSITNFLNEGIMTPILKAFEEAAQVDKAASILTSLASMMTNVGVILSVSGEKILAFTKNTNWWGNKVPSEVDKLVAAIPDFQKAFNSITDFLTNGIMIPILSSFKESAQVEKASSILTSLTSMLTNIGVLLDTSSEKIIAFVKKGSSWRRETPSKADKLVAAIPDFQDAFGSISKFLNEGVMKPILDAFKEVEQVEKASSILTSLTSMMTNVSTLIETMTGIVTKFVADGNECSKKLSPAQELLKLTPIFSTAFISITKFLKFGVMKSILETFKETETVEKASDVLTSLSSMMTNVGKLIEDITGPVINFVTGGDKWSKKLSPAQELLKLIPVFSTSFDSISKFLRDGVMKPILDTFKEVEPVEKAANILSSLSSMMTNVGKLIEDMTGPIANFVDSGTKWKKKLSPAENLLALTPAFTKAFDSISKFLRDGVMQPILDTFKEAEPVEKAANILSSLSSMMTNVGKLIEDITVSVTNFVTEGPVWEGKLSPAKSLLALTPAFTEAFGSICEFFKFGVIIPVNETFQDTKEIFGAMNKLRLLPLLLDSVQNVMNYCMQKMVAFTTAPFFGWFGSSSPAEKLQKAIVPFAQTFEYLMDFFAGGVVFPTMFYFKDIEKIFGTMDRLSLLPLLLDEVVNVMDKISIKLTSFTGGGWFNLFGMVAFGLKKKASMMAEAFGFVAKFIREGIIDPVFNYFGNLEIDRALKILNTLPDVLDQSQKVLDKCAVKLESFSTGAWFNVFGSISSILQSGSAAIRSAIGSTAGLVSSLFDTPEVKTNITATAPPNLDDEMKKDQAGSEPDFTQVSGEELSEIAKYSENLDLLQEILDTLKEIKDSSGSSFVSSALTGQGSTMTSQMHTHKPSSPPNFHRLPGGSFNQGPSRQVTNSGQH